MNDQTQGRKYGERLAILFKNERWTGIVHAGCAREQTIYTNASNDVQLFSLCFVPLRERERLRTEPCGICCEVSA